MINFEASTTMTHFKLSTLIAILALLVCSATARAQEANSKAQAADAARREQALELLKSLATQLANLQSPENRARIGANIADSLWPHDEKRARALFNSVQEDINAGLQNRERDDPRDEDTFAVFLKLRHDTVERIAKHDAELALSFLKATEPTPLSPDMADDDRALQLRLAKQVATGKPDLALKLGRQSLAHGFSNDLLLLLRQLHRKHREEGVTLYKETVNKLRNTDLARNSETTDFARVLTESLTPPVADEIAFRQLVDTLITTALANDCHKKTEDRARFCYQIAPLMGQLLKFDPVRAGPLQDRDLARAAEEEGLGPAFTPAGYYEFEDLVNSGTVDELLALAPKYPELADHIHWRAMLRAGFSGDIERARKIATAQVNNPEMREQMLEELKRMEQRASVSDTQITEALKTVEGMKRLQERIQFLTFVGKSLGPGNREDALKLLDTANGFLEALKPGRERTSYQVALAAAYCQHKSDRGLSMIESLIPKLNELIVAAAKLDGFDTHYLRDGEWNMSANGEVGALLTFMAENAFAFASCDFDRAVSSAAQFERTEIRMMAQVKLAQAILSGRHKQNELHLRMR
jgi:hypothetical protein